MLSRVVNWCESEIVIQCLMPLLIWDWLLCPFENMMMAIINNLQPTNLCSMSVFITGCFYHEKRGSLSKNARSKASWWRQLGQLHLEPWGKMHRKRRILVRLKHKITAQRSFSYPARQQSIAPLALSRRSRAVFVVLGSWHLSPSVSRVFYPSGSSANGP